MKKLFMFLAVAGLATFGASCSSDDSKNDDPKNQLTLAASKTDVKEGEAVTFTVKNDGKAETGAELYIGTEKISNPHTFATKGEYKVVAKKTGAKESAAVTIKVTEKGGVDPEPTKTLVLTASKTEAFVGDVITFTAKDNTGAAVAGVTVTKVGGAVVPGGAFVTDAAGTFKFVASKTGYTSSNEVSVVVKERPAPQGNFVQVGGDNKDIDLTRLYVNGNAQNQAILYSLEDGTRYLIYNVISFTGDTSYSQTSMAVIVPQGTTQLLWPQDVPAASVITIGVSYFEDGALVTESGEEEEVASTFVWGVKPTEETDGVVKYTVGSSVINVKFEGDYEGLYVMRQSAATSVKTNKGMSVSSLKGASKLVNTRIAK